MCQAVFLVSVIAGAIDFFFRQDRRNSTGAIARGTQGEDSFHNGSGFLVYDQLLGLRIFGISIWCARPKPFAALRFGLLNCTDFPAGVPNKPLVEQKQWILCPLCGAKTRLQLLPKTELKEFPLFCPKCKQESIISAKHFMIETKQPDAKTQC